ncbi:hypothetical protein Tco_0648579 [Tanacetum coccineum]
MQGKEKRRYALNEAVYVGLGVTGSSGTKPAQQNAVQSPKIRNNNPVEPKNHTYKPGRQNGIGQRFSPIKSSAVHEKPNTPRSCLRWKPMGRIFKIAGLRWIPTGKMFTDNTTKVDSEPPNGSNDDITNPYECNQTLNVSAGTTNLSADDVCSHQFRPRSSMTNDVCSHQFRPRSSMTNDVCSHQFRPRSSMTNDVCSHQLRPHSSMINDALFLKEKKSVRFSALYLQKKRNLLVFDHSYQHDSCLFHARSVINPGLGHQLMTPGPISSGLVPQPPSPTPNVPPTKNDRDTLFCPMFDEYFNPSPSVAQPVLEVAVQDTPSTSISQTIKEAQSHVIPTSVEEDDHGIVLHTWIMIYNLVFQF